MNNTQNQHPSAESKEIYLPQSDVGKGGDGGKNYDADIKYASFGIRTASFIIDNVIFYLISEILIYVLGFSLFSFAASYAFTFGLFFMCNLKKRATPAKLLLSIKLADENTFKKPEDKQIIARYMLSSGFFALYSFYKIFIGQNHLIWIVLIIYIGIACCYALFNDKVQSWYDKQTKIVVIHD